MTETKLVLFFPTPEFKLAYRVRNGTDWSDATSLGNLEAGCRYHPSAID